jgi:hypothetical protein
MSTPTATTKPVALLLRRGGYCVQLGLILRLRPASLRARLGMKRFRWPLPVRHLVVDAGFDPLGIVARLQRRDPPRLHCSDQLQRL